MNETEDILKKQGIGRCIIDKGEDRFYLDITELYNQIQQNPNLVSKLNYDDGEVFEQVLVKRYKARKDGQELVLKLVNWKS